MGSGSESAAERVAAKWEVGPKEDVVQAFMETLVDPRLPLTLSVNDPPTEDAQNSVARQMHAVVLLYNYYHRKQKPDLEFLDFVSFCKLALLLRPSLIPFMKMMNESELVELSGAEDQLSLTEKAVKDACDIAVALDASKDIPPTEGCLISKVAVLLIDSKEENCLLLFGAITEGVWSLIEKELDESNINQERLAAAKAAKKRKINRNKASTDDPKFLQLGYDAVKAITGIERSALVVLESHVAYSLSKQKSAAQFYMMLCPQSFSINQRVPLKFLVESLQGPLAEKHFDSWTTTTVVEYHRMLPYVGFISSWLSRKDQCLPSLNDHNAQSITSGGQKEYTQSLIPALPVAKYSEEEDHIASSSSEMKVSSSEKIANENSKDYQKKSKHSSVSEVARSVSIFHGTAKDGNVTDEFSKRCDILSSVEKDTRRISLENLDEGNDKHEMDSLSGPSRIRKEHTQSLIPALPVPKYSEEEDHIDSSRSEMRVSSSEKIANENSEGGQKKCRHSSGSEVARSVSIFQSTAKDGNVTDEFSKRRDILSSVEKDTRRISLENLDEGNDKHEMDSLSGPSRMLSQRVVKDDNAVEKIDERSNIVDSAVKEGIRIKLEILDTDCDDQRNGSPSERLSQTTASNEIISEKFNKRCDVTDSATKEECKIYSESLDNSNYECLNGLSSGRSRGLKRMNMCDFTNSCLKNEDSNKKLNSKTRVYHNRRESFSSSQHDAHGPEDDVQLKVEMAEHLKPNDTQCRDEKVTEDNHDATVCCNQHGKDVTENPLVQNQLVSEDLQNALALLYRKRQELCSPIFNMGDRLALYEDYIERIRDGGDVGLARQCIKYIINGNNSLLMKSETQTQDKGHQPSEYHSNHQAGKQTRLSDPFLPGRSSCQDLEYICLKNNWRMPRYSVEPSNGKFMSNVAVESQDLKMFSKGGRESSPSAARESAAAQMIAKIREARAFYSDQD
ncbi:hypothetical protein Salat_2266200 [Sesamum alatum]|uniref:Uncharacterized protein n=1 Tax=Sesamum alatum TaxID=300844 RepID=A0AAE2CDV8_9LAMI|nr:hypothetical protein Salat_2266200 [Sesamum alatum]